MSRRSVPVTKEILVGDGTREAEYVFFVNNDGVTAILAAPVTIELMKLRRFLLVSGWIVHIFI